MGVVYKARQVRLDRTVAVKLIRDAHLASSDDVNRFRAEAAAAAQLRHANIVAIYEVGEHGGQHYFSMEYVQGTSLAALVRESPLPARHAADYVKLVAEAIHHAHTQGVLHRDLKPSNVLLAVRSEHAVLQCGGLPLSTEETKRSTSHDTPKCADDSADYNPKVTDFGLAKRIEGGLNLTDTSQVLGTPSYMPPEQALGKHSEIRPWSDVYSLGAILYEILTCRPPFRAETPVATLEQVCGMDPVSPRLLNPTVPRDLETITLKCLEKDPKQRYQTAQDVADDLRRFLQDEPITARPVGKLERAVKWARRKPAFASLVSGLTLAGFALVCGSLAFFAYSAHVQEQKALTVSEHSNQILERKRAGDRLIYAADINQAQRAWVRFQPQLTLQLLDSLRPERTDGGIDYRGWEWHYLKRLCHSEKLLLKGHTGNVNCVVYSPSGTILASGSSDGTARLWDAKTGQPLHVLKRHLHSVKCVAFSPDNRMLATGSEDATVMLWDVATGTELAT